VIAEVQNRTDVLRVDVSKGAIRLHRRTSGMGKSPVPGVTDASWGPFLLSTFSFDARHSRYERCDCMIVDRDRRHQNLSGWFVGFPILAIPAITAPYPFVFFLSAWLSRRRRRTNGLCIDCGYNLTGKIGRASC